MTVSRLEEKAWKAFLSTYAKSGALERRALRHLHDRDTLDELNFHLATHLAHTKVHALVRTESVWIDGTPQAVAKIRHGVVQCELADLLVLISEVQNNVVRRRSAILIQAKVGTRFDRIPSGASTKKERSLLEAMDHAQPLRLFRDTQAKSAIGTYQLKNSGYGLGEFARYMVMPLDLTSTFLGDFRPFVIGWPATAGSDHLLNLKLFKDIAISLWEGSIGTRLNTNRTCEWTRLVGDLLGRYSKKRMRRFGGFERSIQSDEMASLVVNTQYLGSQPWNTRDITLTGGNDPPSDFVVDVRPNITDMPPYISIISFIVDSTEQA